MSGQTSSVGSEDVRPPHEPSYTIADFCRAEQMSVPTYFKMRRDGLGPKEIRIGGLVRISHRARLDWQARRENPVGEEAEAVARGRAARHAHAQTISRRSLRSPDHPVNRRAPAKRRAAR